MLSFRALVGPLAIIGAGVLLQGQAPPSAADLARRVQARYSTVRDFTAQFTLTQTNSLTRMTAVDRGRVAVKKPGRMRWVTETGSKNEIVADGSEVYSYLPKDRLVRVAPLPKIDERGSAALLLLTGGGDLTRDFDLAPTVEAPAGEWHLTVMPRTKPADFAALTLQVDRVSLRLLGLAIVDEQENIRTFRFAGLRENEGIPDATFVFTIPPSAEVRR